MIVRATIAKLIHEIRSAKVSGPMNTQAAEASPNQTKLLRALAEQYCCAELEAEDRQQIVLTLAETGDMSIVPTLIAALEDANAETRRIAARGLARQGQPGLNALINSIASDRHGECFYRSAHHALYMLQFHAPLRDRESLASLLAAVVAAEAAVLAPPLARELSH